MQFQSENIDTNMKQEFTDTRPQMWNSDEIRDLILYAKDLQQQVDDMKANLITMDAKLKNEEAKVRRLTLTLKQFMNI
jgi:erythromycin esterase-like protein